MGINDGFWIAKDHCGHRNEPSWPICGPFYKDKRVQLNKGTTNDIKLLHGRFGLQGSVRGHDQLLHAGGGLEKLGAAKVQALRLAHLAKQGVDGRSPSKVRVAKSCCMSTLQKVPRKHGPSPLQMSLLFEDLSSILAWLVITTVDPSAWGNLASVKEWWLNFIFQNDTRGKSFASLIMLTSWEICYERNARFFQNVSSMLIIIVTKIKGETVIWNAVGAKHLGSIMPRK
jgi:hypothetical protein